MLKQLNMFPIIQAHTKISNVCSGVFVQVPEVPQLPNGSATRIYGPSGGGTG